MRRILVIRDRGFGDIILNMAAFRMIWVQHSTDHVAVLTTRRFASLLAQSGYFDEVLIDERLKPWQADPAARPARPCPGRDMLRALPIGELIAAGKNCAPTVKPSGGRR